MTKQLLGGLAALLPSLSWAQPAQPAQPARPAAGPYFQQEVNYSIDVTLDDKTHQLTGREKLTYVNNSPDALALIWFHLWPNAYRDNRTDFARQQPRNGKRTFQFAKAADRGLIDGLPASRQDFTDAIRFVLNFNLANPFRLADQVLTQ